MKSRWTDFYPMLEAMVMEIDASEIDRDVRAMQKKYPDATREELAGRATRRAALRAATTGAAAGAAGGALALLALGPDIFNLVRQQSRLVVTIARIYGHHSEPEERFKEVLATLGVATGAMLVRRGVARGIEETIRRGAVRQLARKIAGRYLARRIATIAPLLGTVAGGSVNYLSVRAVGRVAVEYYSTAAVPEGKPLEKTSAGGNDD
jgi:uncharacterized protein (DUF697 family)